MGDLENAANCASAVGAAARPRRHLFKFEDNENDNDLCFQRVAEEDGQLISIPIQICAFSELENKYLVAIDKHGNIFVIELSTRRYLQHEVRVPDASALKGCAHAESQFLAGTTSGKLIYLDLDQPLAVFSNQLSSNKAIVDISFPGQPLQPSPLSLIKTSNTGVLFDFQTNKIIQIIRLEKPDSILQFACFLPNSKQMMFAFSSGSVVFLSAENYETLDRIYPISVRDWQIRGEGIVNQGIRSVALPQKRAAAPVPVANSKCSDNPFPCYCCKSDGSVCLCTCDRYLFVFSVHHEPKDIIPMRLENFALRQCAFMPNGSELLLIGLTTADQLVFIDLFKAAATIIVETAKCRYIQLSGDGKFLAVLTAEGAAHIWSTAQLINGPQEIIALRGKQQCLTDNIHNQYPRERLNDILRQGGAYPAKDRVLIWTALLELPYNCNEYSALLNKEPLPIIAQRVAAFGMQDKALERSLLVFWNCLGHWCEVLAYSDFMPYFFYPFMKAFADAPALVVFEVCVSLFLNHCQLWFEVSPLPPYNYLRICTRILKDNDPELSEFYRSKQTTAVDFAFIVLSNAFADVLNKEQWLQLWDHVLNNTPEFLVFCIVAFNIVLRGEIMRLPDKEAIQAYFRQKRNIDMEKMLTKAYMMMFTCPHNLRPKRFMRAEYQPIPQGVYPEFLNYPELLLTRDELDVLAPPERRMGQRKVSGIWIIYPLGGKHNLVVVYRNGSKMLPAGKSQRTVFGYVPKERLGTEGDQRMEDITLRNVVGLSPR